MSSKRKSWSTPLEIWFHGSWARPKYIYILPRNPGDSDGLWRALEMHYTFMLLWELKCLMRNKWFVGNLQCILSPSWVGKLSRESWAKSPSKYANSIIIGRLSTIMYLLMEEALSMECLNKMCPVYLELLKVNKHITLWIYDTWLPKKTSCKLCNYGNGKLRVQYSSLLYR